MICFFFLFNFLFAPHSLFFSSFHLIFFFCSLSFLFFYLFVFSSSCSLSSVCFSFSLSFSFLLCCSLHVSPPDLYLFSLTLFCLQHILLIPPAFLFSSTYLASQFNFCFSFFRPFFLLLSVSFLLFIFSPALSLLLFITTFLLPIYFCKPILLLPSMYVSPRCDLSFFSLQYTFFLSSVRFTSHLSLFFFFF